jgi:hypothetical protein
VVIGFQLIYLPLVSLNLILKIFAVSFKFVQLTHITNPGDQIIRVQKKDPDKEYEYCENIFIPENGWNFIYESEP